KSVESNSPCPPQPGAYGIGPCRALADIAERNRRLRDSLWRAQSELPPGDIMPCAAFVSDIAIHAHRLEAHRLMQTNAARVGERRAGHRIKVALQAQDREERRIESSAHTHSAHALADIHRDIHRPEVGGSLAVRTCVSIAAKLAFLLEDQPGQRME